MINMSNLFEAMELRLTGWLWRKRCKVIFWAQKKPVHLTDEPAFGGVYLEKI